MRKYRFILFVLLFCSVAVSAQYQKANDEQKKEIIGKISQASGKINTMQCDFTQVKELSFMDDKTNSEGKMFYKKSDKIRWEYTKPYAYAFAIDGKNIFTTIGGKKTAVPAKQSKFFDAISKIMISSISGTGFVDLTDFDADFFTGNNDYKIVLNPVKKEVKDLFSSIQLYAAKSDNRIHSIEMVEKNGDKTFITLKNIQINTAINDGLFSQ